MMSSSRLGLLLQLFLGALVLSACGGLAPAAPIAVAPQSWPFRVRVVSGTHAGEVAEGHFAADPPAGGTGTVATSSFDFEWAGQRMGQGDLDGPLQVRFEGGTPAELMGTGGPQQRRFGFSAGFERGQFGREEESFIAEGLPYFGYLNAETYVDGAGVVELGPEEAYEEPEGSFDMPLLVSVPSRSWVFEVRVVSGSRQGEVVPGSITVASANLPPGGTGTIEANSFRLAWGDNVMGEPPLDARMRVRFEGGAPVELIGVGGSQDARFGFSAGFGREQFGRSEERFIAAGQPYFGYLGPNSVVDGAGTITWQAASEGWPFVVRVVSGSNQGSIVPGRFSVARARLPVGGTGTVETDAFEFFWSDPALTQANLDGPLQVRFEGGVPVELVGTGGPQDMRFGFSAGFERGQFGRDEESFIAEGQPFFGYLNAQTYVDGAGEVELGVVVEPESTAGDE